MGAMDTEAPSCPSQFQLALALAIVKSKPLNRSIREHITNLRTHIVTGKRARLETSAVGNHLDSTAFWREAYEKSEAAQSKLLDRIYELEQRSEARALRESWDNAISTVSQSQIKAPAESRRPTPGRLNKRAKTIGLETQNRIPLSGKELQEQNTANFSVNGSPTALLMKHFYNLQSLLRKKTNPEAIAGACVLICEQFESALASAIQSEKAQMPLTKRSKKSTQSPMEQLSNVLILIYPPMLQGLTRATNVAEAASSAGLIVYHITKLFQKIMQMPYHGSNSLAEEILYEQQPPSKTKRQRKSQSVKPPLETQNMSLCFERLTSTMFTHLDSRKPEHQGLLEGLTFVVLEQVGKVLGVVTFESLTSNEEPPASELQLPLPSCLTTTKYSKKAPKSEPVVAVALQNPKHLIWLLKKAILYMDEHHSIAEQTSGPADKAPSLNILTNARATLQHTLLKGVFGADDIMFEKSLKFPSNITSNSIHSTPAPRVNQGEWFTQEVWTLLGWDSLLECECLAQRT